MTSNIGSSMILDRLKDHSEAENIIQMAQLKDELIDELKNHMRPEFINRVDDIIMFEPLNRTHLDRILDIQLNQVKSLVEKQEMHIEIDNKVKSKLIDIGFNPIYGARPLKRAIQKHVINKLSKSLISGELDKKDINVLLENNEIVVK